MKRKRLTYDTWTEITRKTIRACRFSGPFFTGIAARLDILEVDRPQFWTLLGARRVICDRGYHWLMLLSEKDHYCITAMIDRKDECLVWYIDMIDTQGVDPDGIPYFDDLYLDLVVHQNGSISVSDMNELVGAYEAGEISEEQYRLALDTAQMLKDGLLRDITRLQELTKSADRAAAEDGKVLLKDRLPGE